MLKVGCSVQAPSFVPVWVNKTGRIDKLFLGKAKIIVSLTWIN